MAFNGRTKGIQQKFAFIFENREKALRQTHTHTHMQIHSLTAKFYSMVRQGKYII